MNIIQGLEIQGLTLNTEENFNSIPGLWQWNDARDRVELNSEGNVLFWGDKSIQGNNFVAGTTLRAPYYDSVKKIWISSDTQTKYLRSPRSDYSFTHNGSKFGIYVIAKNTWSLDIPANCFGAVNFGTASGIGLQGTLASNQVNGRFGMTYRGGATQPTKVISNLLNPSNPNYSPSDVIHIQSFVNMGQTLGIKITYGNASLVTAPFFPTLEEYNQSPTQTFYTTVGNTGVTTRVGLLLIYNWTGVPDNVVQQYDARVMDLLNKEKLIFQNIDNS